MPEAQAILVKVRYSDGEEEYFDERNALVYKAGGYYLVVNHDSCTVVYSTSLLEALKEFNRDIVSAEVVEE
jgi:hypothetical protein